MTLEALIFDVDGTLAETEEVHRWAFNETFLARGLDWEWDRALYGELLKVAGGKERLRHFMGLIGSAFLGREDLNRLIAEMHREKTTLYTQRVNRGELELRPGVERLIREARAANVRLAIATTTSRPNVVSLLDSTLGPESLDWFEAIGTAECTPRKKPDPGIYHWVLEQMELPPTACLALEDSANGLRAGLAANIPVMITVSSYTAGDDFARAAAVTDGLGEPGAPLRLPNGSTGTGVVVDLELMKEWHRRAVGAKIPGIPRGRPPGPDWS